MVSCDALDYANGDCHSIGRYRTAEEVFAVRNLGIPAELVRQGILTLEDYAKGNKTKEKTVPEVYKEEEKAIVEPTEEENNEETELTVEQVRELYSEKLGTTVPNNKKNDVEWMIGRINQ